MKVVALVSGGKDSCYNMMMCVADGHEIIALANLRPNEDEVDSYMYQSVGHNVLDLYASAMDLPLFRGDIKGKALNQNFDYKPTDGDEVEDLYKLLLDIKKSHDFEAVSVGAIFSDYQRLRVENVCNRLGLKMLAYLWHRDQAELLKEMIDCKIQAIIIKVAAFGLDVNKHLGMTIEEIYPYMLEMNKKFGLNVCGEGGEFETFTVDCPLFKKRLVIKPNMAFNYSRLADQSGTVRYHYRQILAFGFYYKKEKEVIIHSNDAFAPVAYLKLNNVALEDKEMNGKISHEECIKGLPIKLPSCNVEQQKTDAVECDMKFLEIKT